MSARDLLLPRPATTHALSADALAYVAARYARPDWAKGTISRPDAAFLFDMLLRERPTQVGEIGVASGTSTAFLSTLLADRLPEARLFAFDARGKVYNDPSKPTGAYVRELFGRIPSNLTLKPWTASFAIRDWPQRPEHFDFVFLDADHEHPWPCLDILSMLDLIVPGGWIVLHDTGLPINTLEAKSFGPLYLFQNWPGEKCAPSGNEPNIGAIRLFENRVQSAQALLRVLELPWHARPAKEAWQGALRALTETDSDPDGTLLALIEAPPLAKRVSTRALEVSIRGPNPWSQMSPDLVSQPLVLHANLQDEPIASVRVSGLDRRICRGVIAPSIARSPDSSDPIRTTLALRSDDGIEGPSVAFVLTESEPRAAYLFAPDLFGDSFSFEITVSLLKKATALHGAWVKFKMLHFV